MNKIFCLAASWVAYGLCVLPSMNAQEEVKAMPVWNFKDSAPSYGYEGWKTLGNIGKPSKIGWELMGPAAGGFGIYFNDLLDLSGASKFRIKLVKGENHSDGRLMVKMHAADGKQAVWFVTVSELETGKETVLSLDLANPSEKPEGEPMDLGIVRQIQVQGTFSPENQVHLHFISFDAELTPTSFR
jgi:hypothetical protein